VGGHKRIGECVVRRETYVKSGVAREGVITKKKIVPTVLEVACDWHPPKLILKVYVGPGVGNLRLVSSFKSGSLDLTKL